MTTATLINEIVKVIFEHEFRRLKQTEVRLIKENQELGGSGDGFRYQGAVYTNLQTNLISRGQFKPPMASMIPALAEFAEDSKTIVFDEYRTKQAMVLVLSGTKYRQDVRDALPECLVTFLPFLKDCSRTRPEAYTLADKPRLYNQYFELRDKIEFYLASKMLY